MEYLVLARKWRPQVFEDVLGQEHVVRTLPNAITQERIAHAFLFSGPRGVGKTSIARILAKALNCETGPDADPLQRLRPLPRNHRRNRDRRPRDRRRLQPGDRRDPGAPREREVRPRLLPLQDLHHRRSPHADPGGLQRAPEDPRRAARPRDLHLRDDRDPQGPGDDPLPLPVLRFPADPAETDRREPEEDRRGRGDPDQRQRPFLDRRGGRREPPRLPEHLRPGDLLRGLRDRGPGGRGDPRPVGPALPLSPFRGGPRPGRGPLPEDHRRGLLCRPRHELFYQTLLGHFRNLLFIGIAGAEDALVDLPADETGRSSRRRRRGSRGRPSSATWRS